MASGKQPIEFNYTDDCFAALDHQMVLCFVFSLCMRRFYCPLTEEDKESYYRAKRWENLQRSNLMKSEKKKKGKDCCGANDQQSHAADVHITITHTHTHCLCNGGSEVCFPAVLRVRSTDL